MAGREENQDSYFDRLHLVGVATLLVLTLGLGLLGWEIRPASGGFSTVPDNLALTIQRAPPALAFSVTMSPTGGGGAALTVEGMPEITDVIPTGSFTLVVDHLGAGRICTPSTLASDQDQIGVRLRLAAQHASKLTALANRKLGTHRATAIVGRGYFYVRLCWPSDGPVALNGAYLSARFPAVGVYVAREADGVSRTLDLGSPHANTADYAVQSLPQPTIVTQSGWQWEASMSLVTGLPQPLTFAAVNTSQTQHDSYDAFLSGIVFGIAGGALVSMVQLLVAPVRTRREKRRPEPGG